jgi:hypothetical protein
MMEDVRGKKEEYFDGRGKSTSMEDGRGKKEEILRTSKSLFSYSLSSNS